MPIRAGGASRASDLTAAALPRCEWRLGVPVATWGAEAIAIVPWAAGDAGPGAT